MNTPNPTPLRAAVVGAGYLGRFHAQKYADLPGVELAAVVDVDRKRAAAVAAESGGAAFADLDALLDGDRRIDVASVVVPNTGHFDVALRLLEAGVHVLLEKPLTSTVAQADELITLTDARGLVLQAGHLERFNPAVKLLLERVRDPLFIEAHRLSGFKNRATDVDVVMDLMIHDIDIALALVGRPVREIRASGYPVLTGRVDIANARLEFEGGCAANLTASRVSLKDMRKVRVFQDGAYLAADCARRENVVVAGHAPDDLDAAAGAIAPETIAHGPHDHLRDEIAAFLAAVRGEAPVAVPARAGRDAVDVALRVNAAMAAARAAAD
jgi:predicted dehydrogenase